MNVAALLISSMVIALMAMPNSINLLGVVHGDLHVSILPLMLTAGFVLGAMTAMQRFSASRALFRSTNKYFVFFIVLATASTIWSAYPLTTLYRLYRLYALVLTCVFFCLAGWRPDRFAKAVLPAVLFLTVTSTIYFVIDRNGALEPAEYNGVILPELVGAWRGTTLHKNTLGAMSAMGVIFAASSLMSHARFRLLSWVTLASSLVCLSGARSSTSVFTAAFAVALMALLLKAPGIRSRRLVHLLSLLLVTFFLIYSLGVLNLVPGLGSLIEPIVALTGKDMTFSGRTTIWAIMKDEIVRHPVLGIGYASFWLGPDFPSPAFLFKIRMYIYPGEAHNGYLDVMNELGIIGIVALIAYLFEFLRQAVKLLHYDRAKASLYLSLLFGQLIANMSEAHWWNIASVQFFILTMATFDMATTLRTKQNAEKTRLQQARQAAMVQSTQHGA